MLNKLRVMDLSTGPLGLRVALWLWAFFSVAFIILFVRFLSLADASNLTSIDEDAVIEMLVQLDVFALLALPDFWQVSLFTKMTHADMFLEAYSMSSVLIFSSGLYTHHRHIQPLSRQQAFMLLLCAGWAHFLLAKCILSFSIPLQLTGPVTAVGALSVLYFSLAALLLDAYQLFLSSKSDV